MKNVAKRALNTHASFFPFSSFQPLRSTSSDSQTSAVPRVVMPSYHGITFWQRLHLATILVRLRESYSPPRDPNFLTIHQPLLAFVVVWMLLLNYMPRRETSKQRTATKVIRWVSDKCSYQQIAYFMPSTVDVYKRWMNNRRMDIVVEELAEETKLMWVGVGGKRTDRVVLYVPGKSFIPLFFGSALLEA